MKKSEGRTRCLFEIAEGFRSEPVAKYFAVVKKNDKL